jgi:hypothetical protein
MQTKPIDPGDLRINAMFYKMKAEYAKGCEMD